MRIGEILSYPDAPGPWTYAQAPSACLFTGVPDNPNQTGAATNGDLVVFFNGGSPAFPESNWVMICPKDGGVPRFALLWAGDEVEGETGLFKVCRVPEEWGGRWLMAWSGAWQKDWGVQKAYRVWCGLGTCEHLGGEPSHWFRKQEAIFSSKNVPQQPPPNAWWPNGTWAVGAFVYTGGLFVAVRDNSWGIQPAKQHHLLYQVDSTFTPAKPPAEIILSDWTEYSWLNDIGIGADGKLYALDGQEKGGIGSGTGIKEYVSERAFPAIGDNGRIVMNPSGKLYQHWDPVGTSAFLGGYLKDKDGCIIEPRLILGTAGNHSTDWTQRGSFRLCYWDMSADNRYHKRLVVPPIARQRRPRPSVG